MDHYTRIAFQDQWTIYPVSFTFLLASHHLRLGVSTCIFNFHMIIHSILLSGPEFRKTVLLVSPMGRWIVIDSAPIKCIFHFVYGGYRVSKFPWLFIWLNRDGNWKIIGNDTIMCHYLELHFLVIHDHDQYVHIICMAHVALSLRNVCIIKVELNGGLRSAHDHILSHCKEPDHLPPLQAIHLIYIYIYMYMLLRGKRRKSLEKCVLGVKKT